MKFHFNFKKSGSHPFFFSSALGPTHLDLPEVVAHPTNLSLYLLLLVELVLEHLDSVETSEPDYLDCRDVLGNLVNLVILALFAVGVGSMYRIGRTGRAEPRVVPKRAVALAVVERVEGVAAQTLSRHGFVFWYGIYTLRKLFQFYYTFDISSSRARASFNTLSTMATAEAHSSKTSLYSS